MENLTSTLNLDELNPAQKEAALFNDGPLLVIAGAGSGKTKTVVHRVARLVAEGVPPEAILLLTFTQKASQEMLKRASNILDSRCEKISGGTFHSFANIILRKYGHHLGYDSQFTILDRSDAEDLIQMLRKEITSGQKDKRFPKKSAITSIISKSINTSKTIQAIVENDFPQFAQFAPEIIRIAQGYQKQKNIMKVMDYDDLLIKLKELLTTIPEVQEKCKQKYQYIMVDEYQDTNTLQSDIINAIINEKNNIMVVGDDSQSIYSFRGAHFKNIMKFPQKYPNTTVIKLEQNYRSTQPILDITNAMIERAKEKYEKKLFSEKKDPQKPIYVDVPNENAQSTYICKKILEMRDNGTPLSKMAVLMRSGFHSNDLEVELQSHGLPFIKFGGFKFIEASHIKDLIAFLKVIFNPLDRISWLRVLLLIDGIGPKAANDFTTHIQNQTEVINLDPFKKKKYYPEIEGLINLIYSPTILELQPTEMLKTVIEYYTPLFKLKYDDFNKRESDLESFLTIAKRFENLEKLLSDLTLEPPELTHVDSIVSNTENEDKLTLSTIHSSKGLEWENVFILSVVDGYIPSFQSLEDLGQLEEERRLLYVAMTRAEKKLYIMKPNLNFSQNNHYRFSGMQFSKLSRFLEEFNIINKYAEKDDSEQESRSQFNLSKISNSNSHFPDFLVGKTSRKYSL